MKKSIFLQVIKSFSLVISTIFLINMSVNAKTIADPYINILFDPVAAETTKHGTLNIFNSDNSGLYSNKEISYGVNANGTYMQWLSNSSRGGGFNLDIDKAIGEDYTLALKFSFTDTGEEYGGWKKIIDFQSTVAPDSGFYFYNGGQIQFYPEDSQGPYIKNNQVVDLLIRRNKDTKKFEVYNRVGNTSVLCYEFIDTNSLSVLGTSLGFFHDDYATFSEATEGGSVYSVKIWDSFMEVEDVWEALDKEKEESINRYICRQISAKQPTEIIPGYKSYYECFDQEDKTYKYYEDESLSIEIPDIEKWKEENGFISQTKSIAEIIEDLQSKINDLTPENIKSSDKNILVSIKETINQVNLLKTSDEEKKILDEILEKSNQLVDIINNTAQKLSEIKTAVNYYNKKKLIESDKTDIKNIIKKAEDIKKSNLTEQENKELASYISVLNSLLLSNTNNIENPKTVDNITFYIIASITMSCLGLIIYKKRKTNKIK